MIQQQHHRTATHSHGPGKAIFSMLILLFFVPMSGRAQNLITNGDFDSGVAGWTDYGSSDRRFDWISNDGTSPSGNGCAEHGDVGANGATSLVGWNTQIPASPDTEYHFSVSVMKPAGSSAEAPWVIISYIDSEGSLLGTSVDEVYQGDLSDNAWHSDFSFDFTTPGNAGYVWVDLGVGLPSSGSVEAVLRWDNASLSTAASAPPIFSDNFESGNTDNWDSTVPSP